MKTLSDGRIRSARHSDLQAVEALLTRCKLPVEGLPDFFDIGYCVFEIGDQIAGSAGMEIYSSFGLLRSVAVSEELRGKRIAEQLIRNRLQFARNRGLSHVYLLTTTADSYFVRFAFQKLLRSQLPAAIRESKEFSSICPDSAIVMGLALSDD